LIKCHEFRGTFFLCAVVSRCAVNNKLLKDTAGWLEMTARDVLFLDDRIEERFNNDDK